MAAALGNVDARDNWKVHFRDTMRGGKFLNDWRMAELHAKQAPERVRELEEWGAVFDRTKDGLISQRNFGGHRYPRLAHVGDRTGLELIRSLQDHGVHQGIDFHMECTALELLQGRRARSPACSRYWRETGRFVLLKRCKAVILATGGGGTRLARHVELVGVHRRRLRAGLRRRRRADGHRVHAVPPDRHGVAAVGARHPGHRGRARRRRHPEEQQGRALHVQLHPGEVRRRDRRHRRGGRSLARRSTRTRAARPSCSRATWSRARSPPRSRPAAARRTAACSSTSPRAARPTSSSASCRRCTTSSRSWPRSTSPRSRWRSARRCTTSWAASASTPTRRCRRVPGPVRRRRVRRAACTARTASAATRCPTCSCSASSPATARRDYMRGAVGDARRPTTRRSRPRVRARDRAAQPRRRATNPYLLHDELQDDHGPPRATSCASRPSSRRRIDELAAAQGATPRRQGARRRASTTPAGTRRSSLRSLLITAEAVTRAALMREESRGAPHAHRLPRASATSGCKYNVVVKQRRGRPAWRSRRRSVPIRPRSSPRSRYAKIEDLEGGSVGAQEKGAWMATRTFRVWRGDASGGELRDVRRSRSTRAWSCSTSLHRIQAHAGARPRACAGTARPASAARAAWRSTASRGCRA